MKKTALILAGGRGERFWPVSTLDRPKQFINIIDENKSMFCLTLERILPVVDIGDVFVSTNACYKELIKEQCPDLPERNIICEPAARNTAACIGLGAAYIGNIYGDAVMFVLPADHMINDSDSFIAILDKAAAAAEEDHIITVGIRPLYPETGYGYIRYKNEDKKDICEVEAFVEKPDKEKAMEYIGKGNYLWNAGIFVFKASVILDELKIHLNKTYEGLMKIRNDMGLLESIYPAFEAISIDYAVMEKSDRIMLIKADMGWDDVGSWPAIGRFMEKDENGNCIRGKALLYNCHNDIVFSDDKLLVLSGVDDSVVVGSEDKVLICKKDDITSLRKMIGDIARIEEGKYL